MSYLNGIFIPIVNNNWSISKASQSRPLFALNKFALNTAVTVFAETYGFDVACSIVQWHGYGSEIPRWDYTLQSFRLMSALMSDYYRRIFS